MSPDYVITSPSLKYRTPSTVSPPPPLCPFFSLPCLAADCGNEIENVDSECSPANRKSAVEMGPYGKGGFSGGGGRGSCAPAASSVMASEIDGGLAGAGYKVRSLELPRVVQSLERLESAMTDPRETTHLASDMVHYNPTDLASWVDSMLLEIHPQTPPVLDFLAVQYVDDLTPPSGAWTRQAPLSWPQEVAMEEEEDSGIQLVHLLMGCAEAVERGGAARVGELIDEMRRLLTRVNTSCGIGKVAGYFIDALSRRLFAPQAACGGSALENEVLYHHFYEACPYLKFAHFTANQAILEAFDGHDSAHVIDFNLMHGLQWPALIQALALRPGGPPILRLTGIGPPFPDGRDSLREIGLRLAELARSVNVRFAFRGVAAARLDDVKPWMLQVGPGEAVAVNSVFQLHRLLVPDPGGGAAAIDSVLGMMRELNPKIVTVVEQEAKHNESGFVERFTEALFYYSTMVDSLEACGAPADKAVAEMYIQREIFNVVGCEGGARVERHEPLERWRGRMDAAGFKALHLGSNAFKQASMLLSLFSAEGYCVEETEGCLTLGWHSRPLIAASAWQPADELH